MLIDLMFYRMYLVAKGQKMAMKNYAKQLNSQIEEVVAEVRTTRVSIIFNSTH